MDTIIQTKRLILRELNIADAEHFFTLNSDPRVLRYTGDMPFSSIYDAELFLKNYRDYNLNGYGRWAVMSKSSNAFLGWCGLKLNEEKMIDLGFRFFQKYWNNGYATEAAMASLEYGFGTLGMEQIIGRSSIDNKASIRILEKLGMTFWKNDRCEGIEDAVYYKIDKTQYKNTLTV